MTSLAYTDVSDKDTLIVAANQWFDNSILSETSIKNFYFPSINLKNFNKFNKNFFRTYGFKPNQITIISYDIVGFIYYLWNNDININSAGDLNMKNEIKGKIGKFKISENKVIQKLEISKFDSAWCIGDFWIRVWCVFVPSLISQLPQSSISCDCFNF